jgi:hypothetical protein
MNEEDLAWTRKEEETSVVESHRVDVDGIPDWTVESLCAFLFLLFLFLKLSVRAVQRPKRE